MPAHRAEGAARGAGLDLRTRKETQTQRSFLLDNAKRVCETHCPRYMFFPRSLVLGLLDIAQDQRRLLVEDLLRVLEAWGIPRTLFSKIMLRAPQFEETNTHTHTHTHTSP